MYRFSLILIVFMIGCGSDRQKGANSSYENSQIDTVQEVINTELIPIAEEVKLSALKHTEFSSSLETEISENKNSIYTPTLLFAWDEIQGELKSGAVLTSKNSEEFRKFNASKTHNDALEADEYEAKVTLIDDAIKAEAYFKKLLEFENQFASYTMNFDSTPVESFGMRSYNYSTVDAARIVYYEDDQHFILKLIPKDRSQQILLAKGLPNYSTLAEGVELTNEWIAKGKELAQDDQHSWKYHIAEDDQFSIPKIQFNISTNFNELEGQTFTAYDSSMHVLVTAFQRTALTLNEHGAIVESYAYAVADSAGVEMVETHPKNLNLDQTFLLIMKNKIKENPYFVMKVDNSELLVK